ncbi:ABC transporter permease [Ancylomarina longa]|uniref:ABC transporter permease n=1 Tax=Ancylomarina longa TaxID=2487017 RepID=A0A434AGS1_9BACT|nr:ABC transporter permease [Ancylomarina longa]RUT73566.1 ABC transporter permease [Ancylomarina longa]
MYRNFFINILRTFGRNKFYTALNIIGLTIGLVCTILILLFIQDELSYDKYNVNYERIIRLGSDFTLNGKRDRVATSALPFGPTFKEEFPEVEEFVRFLGSGRQQFKYGDKIFYEERIAYVDSSVFKVFSFDLIKGNPDKALTEPNEIVLSETLAKKYFGQMDPIGKILLVGENKSYKVTGVMRDLPSNSHFRYNAFYSMKTLEKIRGTEEFNSTKPISFWSFSNYTFLLLKKHANSKVLLEKFPMYYNKYMKTLGDQLGVSYHLIIQNLADIHLHSDLQWDAPTGNVKYIYILFIIVIFILSIASINYMNMATARSTKIAKEVGIRKVVGAYRENLIRQFLAESVSITVFAFGIALIIVELILPLFNSLVNKNMVLSFSKTPELLLYSVGITILLGLISGIYPAFYLSSFHPSVILKGTFYKGKSSGLLRKLLVISQYAISAIMISGTIIVASQFVYMNNKDVGFNQKDILVAVVRDSVLRARIEPLKQELKKNPNITAVATSSGLIGFGGSKTVHLFEGTQGMEQYALNFNIVDFDYIDLMEMKVIQGRNFSRKFASDTSSAFIINQAAARKFNWNENSIGKKMQFGVKIEGSDGDVRPGNVIGVVSDFNYQTLENKIEPINLLVSEDPRTRRILHIKINPNNRSETITYIKKVWDKFSPNMSFSYFFLEDRMKENYQSEERLLWIFSIFSIISILIASLGLFGLASFMTEQCTKEIGVRKVLGASSGRLVYLLTREFLQLIIIANIVAIPLSYWALQSWLCDFSYRINIGLWVFVVTILSSVIIGLCTVSWHSYRAASSDPAKALTYE